MEVLCIFKKLFIIASALFAICAVALIFSITYPINRVTYNSGDVLFENIEPITESPETFIEEQIEQVPCDLIHAEDVPTQEELEDMQEKLAKLEEYEKLAELERNKPVGKYEVISEMISDEEVALSALVIYHESRGEPYEGQKGVCEVIFNRLLSPKWPNTVKEIIYQTGQFAVADYLLTANITEPDLLAQAFRIVYEVMEETEYVLPDSEYVYFATTVIGKQPVELGGHFFCK